MILWRLNQFSCYQLHIFTDWEGLIPLKEIPIRSFITTSCLLLHVHCMCIVAHYLPFITNFVYSLQNLKLCLCLVTFALTFFFAVFFYHWIRHTLNNDHLDNDRQNSYHSLTLLFCFFFVSKELMKWCYKVNSDQSTNLFTKRRYLVLVIWIKKKKNSICCERFFYGVKMILHVVPLIWQRS